MYLMNPSYEILSFVCSSELIEKAGRTCYKSECKGEPDRFIRKLINSHHYSIIEHSLITVKLIVDRGFMTEIRTHRLCSFAVQSTRYVNFDKKGIIFIIPPWFDLSEGEYDEVLWAEYGVENAKQEFLKSLAESSIHYKRLLNFGQQPQQARSVLPNALQTEIVVSANAREWRHIFSLRCDKTAHPQMTQVMRPLLSEFQERAPALFDDITYNV